MKKSTLLLLGTFLSFAAFAQTKIYKTSDGAIKGYDPVAYFTMHKPVKGDKQFTYAWNGATWFFSSQDHLNKFVADPEKYAPQYGGFCAYGVAKGSKVKIEPEAWAIVNNKLYLNYDLAIQSEWNKDKSGYIKQADAAWLKISAK